MPVKLTAEKVKMLREEYAEGIREIKLLRMKADLFGAELIGKISLLEIEIAEEVEAFKQKVIGARYGITEMQVSRILSGKQWKDTKEVVKDMGRTQECPEWMVIDARR